MSFELMTLATDGVVDVTGGTAVTFTRGSTDIKDGIEVVDAASTDYRMRKRIQGVFKPAILRPDGTWSKAKWNVKLVKPGLDAFGNVVYDLVEHRMEVHPDSQTADSTLLDELRSYGAQLAIDADLNYFHYYGAKV